MSKLSGVTAAERPPPLSRVAYLRIQQAIRDGALGQDVLYSENELAQSLGMSRTPVREALIALAREGLVEISSQRGFRLRRLSAAQRQEIFDLRLLLEPFSVRKLAETAGEEDVRRLRELVDAQAKLTGEEERSDFLALDEDFHLLIPDLLGLERTRDTMASLRGAMWLMGFEALALPRRHAAVIEEHRAVVDAIAAGDPDAAAEAIHRHIANTWAAVLSPDVQD
ncbi:GntR family transcriptional regulator [Actinomadura roseirufa]|uniref:GntR family transcriptional regulator n=1 Tax=Actinomadura roseirufa TaxID=2094049 RepID=UPI00104172EB|nr:GntR family transcriptional regulator [Actinomadura roseirufa]